MDPEEELLKGVFRKEKIPEKVSFIRRVINIISDIPRQIEILKQRFGISR